MRLSLAPLVSEVWNSIDQLFKARHHFGQRLLYELDELISNERDPFVEARLSLKVFRNEITGALTACFSETSMLGEFVIFSAGIKERDLTAGPGPRRLLLKGPRIFVYVDEALELVRVTFEGSSHDFIARGRTIQRCFEQALGETNLAKG